MDLNLSGLEGLLHVHDVQIGINTGDLDLALNNASTERDWFDCVDEFGERDVGSYLAEWCDESISHPHLSEGYGYLVTDDGWAINVYWDDQGFYSVSSCLPDQADDFIKVLDEEWSVGEEVD